MNDLDESDFLSTTQVAGALGLGVSTVKRWVDEGLIPARKTAGGHRKLSSTDVLEFVRSNRIPCNMNALLGLAPPHDAKSHTPDRLFQHLTKGEIPESRALLLGAIRSGMSIPTLADELVGPAMQRIGLEWERGRIGIAEEHRAAQICLSILYEIKSDFQESLHEDRPLALGCAPEGDHSLLPTLLAEMTLLSLGWNAVNLGPNMPLGSVVKTVEKVLPQLVWLSVSHIVDETAFLKSYRELYARTESIGSALAVGGLALRGELRTRIPYTTYGDNLQQLASFANTLAPQPRRPTRGRPKRS